jgi:hypothetical protein
VVGAAQGVERRGRNAALELAERAVELLAAARDLEIRGAEARLAEAREKALVTRRERARLPGPLCHADHDEAPPLRVRSLLQQARQLAVELAHTGKFAQPLGFARKLPLAVFIGGGLDQGVAHHSSWDSASWVQRRRDQRVDSALIDSGRKQAAYHCTAVSINSQL